MSEPKLTIIRAEDWTAIFRGDELIHWHDTPSLSAFCHLLGIDHDVEDLDDGFLESYEQMPPRLATYRQYQREAREKYLTEREKSLASEMKKVREQLRDTRKLRGT